MPDETGQPTDLELLTSFLWTLYEDLDALVDMREVLFLAPTDFHHDRVTTVRRMESAWIEVLESRADVLDTVAGENVPNRLVDAGLVGHQLRFKWQAWSEARAVMVRALADSDDVEERPRSRQPPEPRDTISPSQPALPRRQPRRVKWLSSGSVVHLDTQTRFSAV
jgi:hypothetical protein